MLCVGFNELSPSLIDQYIFGCGQTLVNEKVYSLLLYPKGSFNFTKLVQAKNYDLLFSKDIIHLACTSFRSDPKITNFEWEELVDKTKLCELLKNIF